MILTDKQAEALHMIKEWANEDYNESGEFAQGVNAAKWKIQTILNLGKL